MSGHDGQRPELSRDRPYPSAPTALIRSFGRLANRSATPGIGILSDNVFAVSAGSPGVAVYHIEHGDKGRRLVGRWTAPGAGDRFFVETLSRLTREVTTPDMPRGAPSPRSRIVLPWFALRAT